MEIRELIAEIEAKREAELKEREEYFAAKEADAKAKEARARKLIDKIPMKLRASIHLGNSQQEVTRIIEEFIRPLLKELLDNEVYAMGEDIWKDNALQVPLDHELYQAIIRLGLYKYEGVNINWINAG